MKPSKENLIKKQEKLLQKIISQPFVVFFLFLLWFSYLFLVIEPLTIKNTQAANIRYSSDLDLNSYVECTPLAFYPSDRYAFGRGFAMRNSYIYSIIGYNPTIIDVSNISNPTFVADYKVENGRMRTLALRDEYLYLGSVYGLEILNISNLANISLVGQCNTSGSVESIALQGNNAYLAADTNGLVIVNISDPTNPEKVGEYKTNLYTWDVAVRDTTAYIANYKESGVALVILDVSDPQHPVEIGHYEDALYEEMASYSITINGSYAYLGTEAHGLFILDITNRTHPEKVGHFYGGTQSIGTPKNDHLVRDVFIKNHYIFEATAGNGLFILDITNPKNPTLVGKYTAINLLWGAYVHETYLFLQDFRYGIVILNLTYYRFNPHFPYLEIILSVTLTPIVLTALVLFIRYRKRKKEREMIKATLDQ